MLIPIISPKLFHETYLVSQHSQPPEFFLLALTICLITLRPSNSPTNRIGPEEVYTSVKVLFKQLPMVTCASSTLIQAGILLAAYEHASGRSELASVSIYDAIRMAQNIGFERIFRIDADTVLHDDNSRLRILEQQNIWWALVILER